MRPNLGIACRCLWTPLMRASKSQSTVPSINFAEPFFCPYSGKGRVLLVWVFPLARHSHGKDKTYDFTSRKLPCLVSRTMPCRRLDTTRTRSLRARTQRRIRVHFALFQEKLFGRCPSSPPALSRNLHGFDRSRQMVCFDTGLRLALDLYKGLILPWARAKRRQEVVEDAHLGRKRVPRTRHGESN